MQSTFLWHDYETFGSDARRDRPCQFAALRTDLALEPVAAPLIWYCRPADDVLPHPDACLITGVTPQMARDRGVGESEFAGRIFEEMTRPGTCSVGYNSFRFDDEVTRFLFFRNFLDPYAREKAPACSRFDVIDVFRLTAALRPDGLQWPRHADGRPSFRLGDLAAVNGVDNRQAHDALADVNMTLALARLLLRAQPRLWQWALSLRDRFQVERLLAKGEPLVHVSSRFPAETWCMAPVLPLGRHPRIPGFWLVWNLRHDPGAFADLGQHELADRLWTPAADLPPDTARLPVKLIRANRCPMLAPMNVLRDTDLARLALDPDQISANARRLKRASGLIERLRAVHDQPAPALAPDAEQALYEGFIPDADSDRMHLVRSLDGDGLGDAAPLFDDHRLRDILPRYHARNWPDTLTEAQRRAWDEYRRRRLFDDPDLATIQVPACRERLDALRREGADTRILDALAAWMVEIRVDELQVGGATQRL